MNEHKDILEEAIASARKAIDEAREWQAARANMEGLGQEAGAGRMARQVTGDRLAVMLSMKIRHGLRDGENAWKRLARDDPKLAAKITELFEAGEAGWKASQSTEAQAWGWLEDISRIRGELKAYAEKGEWPSPHRIEVREAERVIVLDGEDIKIEDQVSFKCYVEIVQADGKPLPGKLLHPGKHLSTFFREHLPPKLKPTIECKRGNGGGYALLAKYCRKLVRNGPQSGP